MEGTMNWKEIFRGLFAGITEVIEFAKKNSSSVNIEATLNEVEGKQYALKGYVEKVLMENDDLKVDKVRLTNDLKEVRHELEQLQKYFKGE
jgi:hypothetical protein